MYSVAIRVDASVDIGTGHVMRCLTLATRLRSHGARVTFICQECEGHLCGLIADHGFAVQRLTLPAIGHLELFSGSGLHGENWRADAEQTRRILTALEMPTDWLIVDHYDLDARWELALGPLAQRIMVIDDLGNRNHVCAILLDQNLHDDSHLLYEGRLSAGTRCFFGPRYALLRPEFDEPGLERERDGRLGSLLVFFGGTDIGNQAARVLNALQLMGNSAPASTVVLGPTNPDRDNVWRASRALANATVLDSTDRMALLIADADLAVGTCGFAAWERCALGLPAVVTITGDNQRDDARILHNLGACINLGDWSSVSVTNWAEVLSNLAKQPETLKRMSVASRSVIGDRVEASAEFMRALGFV